MIRDVIIFFMLFIVNHFDKKNSMLLMFFPMNNIKTAVKILQLLVKLKFLHAKMLKWYSSHGQSVNGIHIRCINAAIEILTEGYTTA